jgi:hypothetical protein
MRPLTLPKLPDRNLVKRTIVCEAEFNRVLEEYALLYREHYAEPEPVETLVPFMLPAFLAKDRAFIIPKGPRDASGRRSGSQSVWRCREVLAANFQGD